MAIGVNGFECETLDLSQNLIGKGNYTSHATIELDWCFTADRLKYIFEHLTRVHLHH
jgi:hypothetical protein